MKINNYFSIFFIIVFSFGYVVDKVVASVGDEAITFKEVVNFSKYSSLGYQEALMVLINKKLKEVVKKRYGFRNDKELFKFILSKEASEVDTSTLKEFFKNNKKLFIKDFSFKVIRFNSKNFNDLKDTEFLKNLTLSNTIKKDEIEFNLSQLESKNLKQLSLNLKIGEFSPIFSEFDGFSRYQLKEKKEIYMDFNDTIVLNIYLKKNEERIISNFFEKFGKKIGVKIKGEKGWKSF